jgi:SdpI/YhfL family protein
VAATFADREVWYETNAQAGRDMIALGVLLTVAALTLPMLTPVVPSPLQLLLYAVILVAGSVVITVRGLRLASRLLEERRRFDAPRPS